MAGTMTITYKIDSSDLEKLSHSGAEIDNQIATRYVIHAQRIAESLARVRTGYMKKHIIVEIDGGHFVLWSQADYSSFNEFGTRKMAAAPFMYPGIESANRADIPRRVLQAYGIL